MAKFTESKWLLEGVTIYALQPHESKHGVGVNRFVTGVQPGYPRPPHEEVEANARLIAASPELYEIVKAVVSRLGSCGYDPGIGAPMTEKARALLAKIDGGV